MCCKIRNVFTVTFDTFNTLLLNKTINFDPKHSFIDATVHLVRGFLVFTDQLTKF